MVDSELISILCCPETKQDVTLLEGRSLDLVNTSIRNGNMKNRGGEEVKEPLKSGLLRSDKKFLYPIRDDIPIMLIDEALPVEGLL